MSFDAIWGQEPAVETLRRALGTGRLHHAYRFFGPPGVGKERAAFALAQALVCEAPTPLACGQCAACHRALTLSDEEPHVPLHPDVVLVGRGVYPAASLGGASEATGISVEQIRRVVLSRAGYPPHEGRALVFIVRDADELTVAAANCMLKTLEEPGDRTHFVLLTSRESRLLDTIRSRTLAVRFGPLPDAVVARILSERGADPGVAAAAQGSAELALLMADEDRSEARRAFLAAADDALQAPDLAHAIELGRDRKETRYELRDQLSSFAQRLANEAKQKLADDPWAAERAARRHAVVMQTMEELEANVQPALALDAMVTRLRAQ